MTVQNDTEAPPDAGQWLDHLDDATALAVMLDDQAEAANAIRQSLGQIEMAAAAITKRMAEDDTARIIYAGAGASIRIAVQDGVELLPTFNWPRDRVAYLVAGGTKALIESVEDAEDDEAAARRMVDDLTLSANDVVIAIAASGRTSFTCTVLSEAIKSGAFAIGLANNPDTPLLNEADIGIPLITGGEALAGSTRVIKIYASRTI